MKTEIIKNSNKITGNEKIEMKWNEMKWYTHKQQQGKCRLMVYERVQTKI